MVDEGLLERVPRFHPKGGQKSNEYGFDGLIKRCRPFAEEIVAERKKAQLARKGACPEQVSATCSEELTVATCR